MSKKPDPEHECAPFHGASPWLYAVRDEFMTCRPEATESLDADGMLLEVRKGRQSLWLSAKWKSGGGVLIRTAYTPEGILESKGCEKTGDRIECNIGTSIGSYRVLIEVLDQKEAIIHILVRFTPIGELNIPFWPVDVYPIDGKWDPLGTDGIVHAAQRGPATGFMYMTLTKPESGSILYFQNLTSLNDYCEKTHTVPETRVGGSWPEMGYTPPIAERKPLPAGEEVILSDAYIQFSHEVPIAGGPTAMLYLDMLAAIYKRIPKPLPMYRHWLDRAEDAVRDLAHSPDCTVERYGHRYVNAYVGTNARRPESLVQLAVLLPLLEYQSWSGRHYPLSDQLKANLVTFYDERIKSVLRYPRESENEPLHDVDEKEPWEVDSWYLYHPLVNLARLAKLGDQAAKKLLLDSLDYAIWVAHHFDYKWPVLFSADTLDTLRDAPDPKLGETDVPGLYAYLMLEVRDITGDDRYTEEAKRAADSLTGLQFNLGYQFNNTAWAANAMTRLWNETGDENYLKLSYVCIASIMQNTFLWDCDYGYAKHYETFFGVTPLREGAYIAMYEQIEIAAAFYEYLELAGDHVPPSVRLLMSEYCKYSNDGKFCFYPESLPEEVISREVQNGHINRRLAVPLEDIYQGWEAAGQVGQEIYGAGASWSIVTRAYHQVENAPFLMYCHYPVDGLTVNPEAGRASFHVWGDSSLGCELRLIPNGRAAMLQPKVRMRSYAGVEELEGAPTEEGHLSYMVMGDSTVTIEWSVSDLVKQKLSDADIR